MFAFATLLTLFFASSVLGENFKFEEIDGVETNNNDPGVGQKNTDTFNELLGKLKEGDSITFSANHVFTFNGGIKASNLKKNTFIIDGTLEFLNDREKWPKNEKGEVEECMYMENIEDIKFTSNTGGIIDGKGKEWWGAIKFLKYQEDRPRILHIKGSKNVLMENLLLKDSPYWTFYAEDSDGLLIRHTNVTARWTDLDKHTLIDLQAFNTDGFDVTGKNVYIHDCYIWNQDDCISVKDGSENMLFERITCSGLGLVVGSIGDSMVRNITFRDSYMPNTFKGIYLKTRWYDSAPVGDRASIQDILYENIIIENPEQYGIWIGPAQQTGQPCSLLWTVTPNATCDMSGYQIWNNITLKNIQIFNPKNSPGVLMGNATYPMTNITFEDVVVHHPGTQPFGTTYYCEGIEGYAKGNTKPVPPCFKQIN